MKSPNSSEKKGGISLRLLLGIALALLPLVLLAQAPGWWSQRGVTNSNSPNDYAAVNQGQVKNIAVNAVAELDENLSQFGGAGPVLEQLAVTLSGTTPNTNDYAAVNLGQLKNLAMPFYDRLLQVGYRAHPLESGTYPWVGGSPNDYAMANIGQVKNLFSFEVTLCTDESGLPDWWRQLYSIAPGTSGTSTAPRGDGLSYLDAYQQGLHPVEFYNGQAPTRTITSGNNQTGSHGTFLFSPLAVRATDGSGAPLANAPVTFTSTQGGGTLQATSDGINASALTLKTNALGYAIVYFQLPNTTNTQCLVTCAPGSGSYSTSGTFTENSDDGSGSYPTPTLPPNTVRVTPPVVSYPAIDVSGGSAPGNIASITLDDNNNGAFAYFDPDGVLSSRAWANGQITGNVNSTGLSYEGYNVGTEIWALNPPSGCAGVQPDGTIFGNLQITSFSQIKHCGMVNDEIMNRK